MKKLLLFIAASLLGVSAAWGQATMCSAVTTTGACTAVQGNQGGRVPPSKTYQAVCRTTNSTGSAVVAVEGSNDGTNFDSIGTITLSLTTSASSGSFTSQDRYIQNRGNVTTLTGTGANCTLTMGY
jgi:hypothetical protein